MQRKRSAGSAGTHRPWQRVFGQSASELQNLSPASEPVNYSPRLNSYLLRHNQVAGAAGRQGFVSFVPIVANPAPVETESAVPADEVGVDGAASADTAEDTPEPTR